jgi:hypothetical protein
MKSKLAFSRSGDPKPSATPDGMSSTPETETVRPLATEFRHGGFRYRQVKREGNVAIFAQSKGGAVLSYEVVVVRVKPGGVAPSGTVFPTREAYPSTAEWGQFAWTCMTLERAEARFAGLVQEMAEFADLSQIPQASGACRG